MIHFIGAGPGDPELLTRKAWRILGEARVILHDALLDREQLKNSFPNARWIDVGKRASRPSVDQRFTCRLMIASAKRGYTVVRLKGGDPAIFGRISEEIEACRSHNIPFEIVPGITAACAAAADLQASLTLRGISRSVVFVTPSVGKHESAGSNGWLKASLAADTVVIYMAGAQAQDVARTLLQGGKSPMTPLCVVENASQEGAREKFTLGQVAQHGLRRYSGPLTLLVGEAFAAALAEHIVIDRVFA
ncbi:MAG: uroporphyrinogen-III C-methyltransferase [Burkholderiales bacterium]